MSFPLNKIIKEACVETLEQAILAEKNGAHRIELCGRLDLGGITPDYTLIDSCLTQLSIPTKVMIRPRGGNFHYSESEVEQMLQQIEACKKMGVEEYVLGALLDDFTIDTDLVSRLSANVGTAPITFHKAIDEVPDFKTAINSLKNIPNIKYILTSGLAETAAQGIDVLKEMIVICGDEIEVIVAGKVTDENIETLHAAVNAKEYHGRKVVGDL